MTALNLKTEALFIMHSILSFGAFLVPVLISWEIIVPVLLLTVAQHAIFGRCLLMAKHGVSEEDGSTFYSHFFERFGFHPNKKRLRFFVRKVLYSLLALLTLLWQVYLGKEPLLF